MRMRHEFAESFFRDDVIDLGSDLGPNIDLTFGYTLVADGTGGFGFDLAVGGAVPEPSTWAMMLVGFAGLGYAGYRRARQLPPIQSGHQAMYDVWRSLEGPVVNPTMVKEAMLKAKEKGAVWDGAAWSIFDRAITIDPAVMVTTTTAVTSPV